MGTSKLTALALEVTAFCNLTCTHCYVESGPHRSRTGTMCLDDWLRVLADAAGLGCPAVQFIGGEPTLHPELPSMVARADELGFRRIEVFTNATTLTPSLAAHFARHRVSVAVSFYSTNPLVHERITTVRGSYDRTVSGIRTALAAGLPIRGGVIVIDQSPEEVDQAMTFLRELGVRDCAVDPMRMIGRPAPKEHRSSIEDLCGWCAKGKLAVTSDARIHPCVMARAFDMGSAKEGIRLALESDGLRSFRREVEAMRLARESAERPADGSACDASDARVIV